MLWLHPRLQMNERGSATLVALGWIALLVLLAGFLLEVSQSLITASRLQAATDRAALGAVDVLVGVRGELPCSVAREILRKEHFDLESCELRGQGVRVISQAFRRGVLHTARAHAGVVDGGLE